jgi:DNA-binding transcriptional LysR family regulator
MTISRRDLEYFAVIAEHKHIGRAAEALDLSQPALSMCLHRLQVFVGTKLVTRSPTGVELTAAGHALLKHVNRIRAAYDDIVKEISQIEDGRVGHVIVGTTDGSSNIRVVSASTKLINTTPRVTLSIIADDQVTLLTRLQRGEIDLLVTGAPGPEAPGLTQMIVAPDRAVIYCSVNHPLAKRKGVSLKELVKERWALQMKDGTLHQWLKTSCQEQGLDEPYIALASAPLELRLRIIGTTRLLGISSRTVVNDAAERHGLRELSVRGVEPLPRHCVVIHREGGFLSAAAKRLVSLLLKAK